MESANGANALAPMGKSSIFMFTNSALEKSASNLPQGRRRDARVGEDKSGAKPEGTHGFMPTMRNASSRRRASWIAAG